MLADYSPLYKCIEEINQSDLVIERWNNVIQSMVKEAIIAEHKLSENMLDKYLFDFDGLLRNEFDVAVRFFYPNYLVNGLRSSLDFDGTLTTIKLIDPSTLARYEEMVRDKKTTRLSSYFK